MSTSLGRVDSDDGPDVGIHGNEATSSNAAVLIDMEHVLFDSSLKQFSGGMDRAGMEKRYCHYYIEWKS